MANDLSNRVVDVRGGRLDAERYALNFAELHPPLDAHEASVEADRCYFCHDAPCMQACPTSIDIPLFIRQIATGNSEGAAVTILEQNILGGMCARVCPTETLCEEACVRNAAEEKPVRIGELQRFATDRIMEKDGHPFERAASTRCKVAVVGAGPAGLSCAHRLAMLGHEVTLFEAREKLGGLNEHGIAAYKTVDQFAAREVAFVLGIGGIKVEAGKRLGSEVTLDELRAKHDAVFLGIGLGAVNDLGIEDADLAGVIDAVRYIADLRQVGDYAHMPMGRKVVVIGGGMTAIDIAIQSRLLGAEDVTIAYRRGPEQMGASRFEQQLAQTKGVTIKHWVQPVRAIGGTDSQIRSIVLERTRLEDGHLVGTGETFTLEADILFKAIGQALHAVGEVPALEAGRIRVDEEGRTSLDGVWAGGDCVLGGQDLTVTAVEHGKRAALSIHRKLRGA